MRTWTKWHCTSTIQLCTSAHQMINCA